MLVTFWFSLSGYCIFIIRVRWSQKSIFLGSGNRQQDSLLIGCLRVDFLWVMDCFSSSLATILCDDINMYILWIIEILIDFFLLKKKNSTEINCMNKFIFFVKIVSLYQSFQIILFDINIFFKLRIGYIIVFSCHWLCMRWYRIKLRLIRANSKLVSSNPERNCYYDYNFLWWP